MGSSIFSGIQDPWSVYFFNGIQPALLRRAAPKLGAKRHRSFTAFASREHARRKAFPRTTRSSIIEPLIKSGAPDSPP